MKANLLLLFLLLHVFSFTLAQKESKEKKITNKSILALPVVFRLPETGWGGGVVGVGTWNWTKDRVDAKPSQVSAGITYTQKKQILLFLPFKVFLDNNKYYFNADIGWYKYNFFYFGTGEDTVPQEKYDVRFPRIRFLASKQIGKNFYVGARINYEEYTITGTQEGGELEKGKIPGSDYSRTSAIGPALLIDTRDNVFYPRKGLFGEFNILPALKIFGSDRDFVQSSLDLSAYKEVGPKLVWANNLYGVVTFGDETPFSQMALLGGSKRMRGVYDGYFRDFNAALLQTELRWEVWRFIGLAAFGSMGFIGDQSQFLRFNKPKYTGGVGLRVATKKHLNIRMDYGTSSYDTGKFYVTIGEAF